MRKTRPPLHPKSNAASKGLPLTYSHAVERRYASSLTALIHQMTATYRRELTALYASRKTAGTFDSAPSRALAARQLKSKEPEYVWNFGDFEHGWLRAGFDATTHDAEEDQSFAYAARVLTNALAKRFIVLFGSRAQSLAETQVRGVERYSALTLEASLASAARRNAASSLSLPTDVIAGRVKQIMSASVIENVALIKSIPSQYADSIQQAVMRSIVSGKGMADLKPHIDKLDVNQTNRAQLIARDQTSKTTSAINTARMKDLGIKKFEWLHSAGSKEPRPIHVALSGGIYSLDDPPISEPDGSKLMPGLAVNCRCRTVPIVDFSE